MTSTKIYLYSVTQATTTSPAVYTNTDLLATGVTKVYDASTDIYTIVTAGLAAGDYVIVLEITTTTGDYTLTYKT